MNCSGGANASALIVADFFKIALITITDAKLFVEIVGCIVSWETNVVLAILVELLLGLAVTFWRAISASSADVIYLPDALFLLVDHFLRVADFANALAI